MRATRATRSRPTPRRPRSSSSTRARSSTRAKEESVNAILEMAQLKRDGACKRLVVTGCLAERYRDQLKAEIPEIDVVLGTGEVPEIVGALERRRSADGARQSRCSDRRRTRRGPSSTLEPRASNAGRHAADLSLRRRRRRAC